ncbi:MAG: zinc ribbon domain-containing protein [Desulfarculus sp.]|nr:zinc ribbon domain-containing protein [Desulfarculus sp.]
MPLYDYQCNNCEHVFEVWQGMDDPDPECPLCTCPQVTRLISAVAIHTRADGTSARVESEFKRRLGQGRARDALRLADKAVSLAGNKKGMGKIKAARDKLRGHLGK